jgi:hypothetical protein
MADNVYVDLAEPDSLESFLVMANEDGRMRPIAAYQIEAGESFEAFMDRVKQTIDMERFPNVEFFKVAITVRIDATSYTGVPALFGDHAENGIREMFQDHGAV